MNAGFRYGKDKQCYLEYTDEWSNGKIDNTKLIKTSFNAMQKIQAENFTPQYSTLHASSSSPKRLSEINDARRSPRLITQSPKIAPCRTVRGDGYISSPVSAFKAPDTPGYASTQNMGFSQIPEVFRSPNFSPRYSPYRQEIRPEFTPKENPLSSPILPPLTPIAPVIPVTISQPSAEQKPLEPLELKVEDNKQTVGNDVD